MKKIYCSAFTAGLTLLVIAAPRSGYTEAAMAEQPAPATAQSPVSGHEKSDKTIKNEDQPLAGKVLETISTGGYTYILVEAGEKKEWVAVPPTKVTVGQEIQVKPGMAMGRFESKSLKRTFDNIIFSPGLITETNNATDNSPSVTATTQMPAGHPGTKDKMKPKGMAAMFGAAGGKDSGTLSGKVVETRDAGGYTYVNLEKDGKQTWAAVPVMKVKVGEELDLEPGAVMTNFTSKSMNRTFESVVFSGGPIKGK